MEQQATKHVEDSADTHPVKLGRAGLRFRMTVSYVVTTVIALLLIEALIGTAIWAVFTFTTWPDQGLLNSMHQTAKLYALAAAAQAGGGALDPRTTFAPDQPASIALPQAFFSNIIWIDYHGAGTGGSPASVVLLITPDGRVLASSDPAHYATGLSAANLLAGEAAPIAGALAGAPGVAVEVSTPDRRVFAVEPVRGRDGQTLGAVYAQAPALGTAGVVQGFLRGVLASTLLWVPLTLLVGAVFALLTTRGVVRRLGRLAGAATRFAGGDYTPRVPVARRDEVGLLEEHFNAMAAQLAESTAQRQAFAAQNARLAERTRLARDLHDSVKQQVFAVAMQLGAAQALWERAPAEARRHLGEADTLAYHVQQELTTLIQELRPLALQEKSLNAALAEYVETWSRQQGIAAEADITTGGSLPAEVEEALWRVAQEALSNVARHSGATQVRVRLAGTGAAVCLVVEDNGRGFDPASVDGAGVGLQSMRERMATLGGRVAVQSEAGGGTRVEAQAPCPAAARASVSASRTE